VTVARLTYQEEESCGQTRHTPNQRGEPEWKQVRVVSFGVVGKMGEEGCSPSRPGAGTDGINGKPGRSVVHLYSKERNQHASESLM
jgi:hypothetical protein